jgi:hypothetical protein
MRKLFIPLVLLAPLHALAADNPVLVTPAPLPCGNVSLDLALHDVDVSGAGGNYGREGFLAGRVGLGRDVEVGVSLGLGGFAVAAGDVRVGTLGWLGLDWTAGASAAAGSALFGHSVLMQGGPPELGRFVDVSAWGAAGLDGGWWAATLSAGPSWAAEWLRDSWDTDTSLGSRSYPRARGAVALRLGAPRGPHLLASGAGWAGTEGRHALEAGAGVGLAF